MMNLSFENKAKDEMAAEIAQAVQEMQSDAPQTAPETELPVKCKVPLTHRMVAKVIAFMLVILMAIVAIDSGRSLRAYGTLFTDTSNENRDSQQHRQDQCHCF